MRLLLVRHGQSQGNVDHEKYVELGDINVGLTDLGWKQAIKAGEFLSDYYAKTGTDDWPRMFVSAYKRPKETLSGLLHGMDGTFSGQPKLNEDMRLIEQFYGAASQMTFNSTDLDWRTASGIRDLCRQTYAKDKFMSRNMLGESKMDNSMRARSFIEGTLAKEIEAGEDDFELTVHGAVIQEIMRLYAGLPIDKKIKNPNNCDVIEIIGEPGNCTITKIYDGELMTPVNDPYVDHIKPFEFDDLPEVPQHILDDLAP